MPRRVVAFALSVIAIPLAAPTAPPAEPPPSVIPAIYPNPRPDSPVARLTQDQTRRLESIAAGQSSSSTIWCISVAKNDRQGLRATIYTPPAPAVGRVRRCKGIQVRAFPGAHDSVETRSYVQVSADPAGFSDKLQTPTIRDLPLLEPCDSHFNNLDIADTALVRLIDSAWAEMKKKEYDDEPIYRVGYDGDRHVYHINIGWAVSGFCLLMVERNGRFEWEGHFADWAEGSL